MAALITLLMPLFFVAGLIKLSCLKFYTMKRLLIVLILAIFVYGPGIAQEKDSFTIYLVRHAEKVIDKENLKDPPLTPCGAERAESISRFLTDIGIERIYSTDYTRTRETALPTATLKDLEIEIYSPSDLESIAEILLKRGEDALVVGHSNSTPVLAGLLAGEQGYAIPDNIYNQVYQVVICGKEKQLNIFSTAFECTKDKGTDRDK